jgi:hypothetical protein
MSDDDACALLDRFLVLDVAPDEWTHDAHVAVCWAALRHRSPADVAGLLRTAIRRHNEANGTPNTPTSGYHETITRYYVDAIADLGDVPAAAALASPRCRRDAPLGYWHRDTLLGRDARARWVEPDRAPLPWPTTTDDRQPAKVSTSTGRDDRWVRMRSSR